MINSSDKPITVRELRKAFDELKEAVNQYTKPKRSRETIIRDMISACDRALPPGKRRDPDLVADVLPRSERRAADAVPGFHRAPVGIVPRPAILATFDAGIKAAGEKMRAAFRPTA